MCRKCYTLQKDVLVGSMRSKYNEDEIFGPMRGFAGQCLWEVLGEQVDDPFARNVMLEKILTGFVDMKPSVVSSGSDGSSSSGTSLCYYDQGIPTEYWEFQDALKFLRRYNPTRMKAIEQLESNYHRAIQTLKQQKRAALASLQTRQSLEMDMLTNQRDYSKTELEALVGQHIGEVDGLVSHWDREISSLQEVQLKEYRELVMEVYSSEKSGIKNDDRIEERKVGEKEKWERFPLPPHTEWLSITPIAAMGDGGGVARCIRLIHLQTKEDFVSSVVNPILSPNEEIGLDPEELCFIETNDTVVSGAVLGISADLMLRSNQDIQLVQILDKCPVDCRWPCFLDQVEAVKLSRHSQHEKNQIMITRHSNLSLGIEFLIHQFFEFEHESTIDEVLNLLELADSLRIERLYVPDVLVPDLRSPLVIDKQTRPDSAKSFLTVLKEAIRKMNNVSTSKARLREIVVIRTI